MEQLQSIFVDLRTSHDHLVLDVPEIDAVPGLAETAVRSADATLFITWCTRGAVDAVIGFCAQLQLNTGPKQSGKMIAAAIVHSGDDLDPRIVARERLRAAGVLVLTNELETSDRGPRWYSQRAPYLPVDKSLQRYGGGPSDTQPGVESLGMEFVGAWHGTRFMLSSRIDFH